MATPLDRVQAARNVLDQQSTIDLFLKSAVDRVFVAIVNTSLNETPKTLNPDSVLQASLMMLVRTKNANYLRTLGLALRAGASPNVYINGIHSVAYVLQSSPDAAFMLMTRGTNTNVPVAPTSLETLAVWLAKHPFTIKDKNIIGLYLDDPSLLSDPLPPGELMIKLLANKVLINKGLVRAELNRRDLLDSHLLRMAAEFLNVNAYRALLNFTAPTYVLLTRQIWEISDFHQKRLTVPRDLVRNMVVAAVSYGAYLDTLQIKLLPPEIAPSVISAYQAPIWKKDCLSEGDAPASDDLKRVAVFLGIDPAIGQKEICRAIKTMTQADKVEAQKAAVRRQQFRLASETGYVEEFISKAPVDIQCENRARDDDASLYNEIDSAAYRDKQGKFWCFTRNEFPNLIQTRVNPSTKTPLPEPFIEKMKEKLRIAQMLGIHGPPQTFKSHYDRMVANDNITNDQSRAELEVFRAKVSCAAAIEKMSTNQLHKVAQTLSPTVSLLGLPQSNALMVIIYIFNRLTPETVKRICGK